MRTCSVIAASVLAFSASADILVHGVSTTRWGLLGAQIGVGGATVESFEDVNLAPGLQVRVTTGNGSYGPTSTLPSVFDTRVDAFGTAFLNTQWDGVAALVNTATNQPRVYNDPNNWGDVELIFNPPVRLAAFSVAQREVASRLVINGVDRGELGALSGIPTGSGRGGYVVVDATGADLISSIKIDNQSGDGIAFDHVAFSTDPRPTVSVHGFGASLWGAPPATLGLEGAVFEDFEDAALIPRLRVEWDCPAGHSGPTGVLPRLFNPITDDPFGNALDQGVWDGTHCLSTGFENQSWPYPDGTHWGDIVFTFDPPAASVGFSLEDYEFDARMIINGRDVGRLETLTGLPYSSRGRNGYIRIDGPGQAIISTIRLANGRVGGVGDAYGIDHLGVRGCGGDFNGDGFLDFFDYDDFVRCFETSECPPGQTSDFNGDGFTDFFDYDDYVAAFETGC